LPRAKEGLQLGLQISLRLIEAKICCFFDVFGHTLCSVVSKLDAEVLSAASVADAVGSSVEQESTLFHPKQNFHLG
jgi:hypothetical protein